MRNGSRVLFLFAASTFGAPLLVLVAVTGLCLAGNVALTWQDTAPTVDDFDGPVRLAVLVAEGVLL